MEYVYAGAAALPRQTKVGDGDCVALIQKFTNAGVTAGWRQGAAVLNNKQLRPGTAIATFVKGRYPRLNTGNHAAFFLPHGIDGFWVIDPSNNAAAFYVIETK